jgi:hypothetical protein
MAMPQSPEIQTPGEPIGEPVPGEPDLPDDNPPIDAPIQPEITDPDVGPPGTDDSPMPPPEEPERGSDR